LNALTSYVASGEIITARDGVRVIGSPHPLRNDRQEWHLPAGLSIAELLALTAETSRIPSRLVVYLDGHSIPEELWSKVRPKSGTCLVFRARVEGQGFKSIALIAVAVLALVVAPYIAGPLLGLTGAALTIGTALISAAITVGGTLLVNALFPIRPPEALGDVKQRYSITGASNQAAPYQPIPVVLGRHRIFPVHAAKPYTEIIGDDQFLRMFVVWGYGPLDITDMKLGETDLSSFDEVEVETDLGYDGDPTTSLFPSSVLEEQLQIELEQNQNNDRTTVDNVDEVSVDITFPQGIYSTNEEDGGLESSTVNLQVLYRPAGSGGYILAVSTAIKMKQREVVRRTFRIIPGTRGQFDVRVIRTDNPRDDGTDKAVWTAVRGLRWEVPIKFKKPIATTALRIRATNQLNGTINNLNGIATSVAKKSGAGSWGDFALTNNPADLMRWVLQGTANSRPVPDSKLDLVGLAAWGAYCDRKGYKFNTVVNSPRSVYAQCADIAAAGRAVVIFRDGKWSVVWDDTDDNPAIVQHFTPRNSWGFTGSRAYKRMPHGWRVSFVNERNAWQDDERIVYDDGYSAANATEFEAIEFPGVTDPDLIWKHGRFHIAQARLRPETYELTVDFENLVCIRGDRVRVTHDAPLWGQMAGRVSAVAGSVVTVDETLTMEADKLYCIRFRTADGASIYREVATSAGEGKQVTLTGSGTSPDVGNLFMFGERNRESVVLRVLSIEPADNLTAKLTLVDDAPAINDADKGTIPQFDSNISAPVDPSTLAPHDLRASEFLYAQGSSIASGVTLTWLVERTGAARYYEVQRTTNSGPDTWQQVAMLPVPQTTYDILGLDPGTYGFRVRAVYEDGGSSSWATLLGQQIFGLYAPPANVTGFYINVLRDTATLSWNAVRVLNLSHYEVRFSPLLSDVTWGSSTPIQPHVTTTSLQVPSMSGTFLIKAVTAQGVYSPDATVITSDIPGLETLNAVATITEDPTFAGVKESIELIGGSLRLGSASNIVDWLALSDVESMYTGSTGLVEGGIYYFDGEIDLGDKYVSRITTLIDAHGETTGNTMSSWLSLASISLLEDADPSEWDVTVDVRKTDVDPALDTWTEWKPVIVGDVLARAMQFRARLESTSNLAVVPVVDGLAVKIDMDDRIDAGADIAAGTGGATITFSPPFKSLLGLAISTQNMATGDYYAITAKDETGFHIGFFNTAGTGIARTFDWTAKGYGRAA
jgi:hypothetical protein